ncbi:chromate resistance protein ChrB domain-containing protein [Nonomuraea sp. NPDC059194]|uniref:chromate resistance protein ChrB domain-containing protein n=1 Tax=Nonomuraea sp. NPDC059194 TaxID=3346764 RepID=UPI0036C36A0B
MELAEIEHEADIDDERFDAPEAPGLDVALRGLSMICGNDRVLDLTGPLFDGLYEFRRHARQGARASAARLIFAAQALRGLAYGLTASPLRGWRLPLPHLT